MMKTIKLLLVVVTIYFCSCMPPETDLSDYYDTVPTEYIESDMRGYYIVLFDENSKEFKQLLAKELRLRGFDAEVYLTNKNNFSLVLGQFTKTYAEKYKRERERKIPIRLSLGYEFVSRIYPVNKSGEKEYMIVLGSHKNLDDAMHDAEKYQKKLFKPEIYISNNDYLATVIGKFSANEANELINHLLYFSTTKVRKDIYKLNVSKFVGKIDWISDK